jgi:hypothetical protein
MSGDKFRVGDLVSVNAEVVQSSPGQGLSFIRIGTAPNDISTMWVKNSDLTLVKRELSIGDKVAGSNLDASLLDVAGEIIGIHNNQAWIVRPDGTYTVCPLAGLKAV